MKILNVSVTKESFYLKYLLLLNGIFELRGLGLKVFAEFLYWNDVYGDLPDEERNMIVFSISTKTKIAKKLNISRASLDNQITYLRKMNFLLGVTINPIYEIRLKTHDKLGFIFNVEEDD